MNTIQFKIFSQNYDTSWKVLGFHSNFFGINTLYKYRVELLSPAFLDWESLKNKEAELSWSYCEKSQTIRGIVTQMVISEPLDDQWHVVVTLRSPLYLLHVNQHNRTWPQTTLKKVFADLFKSYSNISVQCRFSTTEKHPLICQYNQRDLVFFRSLLAKHRLYYFWHGQSDRLQLIIVREKENLAKHQTVSLSTQSLSGQITTKSFAFDPQIIRKLSTNKVIQDYLRFKTNATHLALYDFVNLNQEKLQRIIRIAHHGEQIKQSVKYFNEILTIPHNEGLKITSSCRTEKNPAIFLAKIVGHDDYPHLNNSGDYQIQFLFDAYQNFCLARQLQPYGGKSLHRQDGIHFPLKKGTLVVVGFENNRLEKPVILGAFNTHQMPDLVTSNNPFQNRIKTNYGNEMLWDDHGGNIELHTKNRQQSLLLSGGKKPGISIQVQKGDIHFHVAKQYQTVCQKNVRIHVGRQINSQVETNQIITKQGSIKIQATKKLLCQMNQWKSDAQNSSSYIRKKHTITTRQFDSVSKNQLKITTNQKIFIQANHIQLQAKDHIQFNQAVTLTNHSLAFQTAILDSPIIGDNPA